MRDNEWSLQFSERFAGDVGVFFSSVPIPTEVARDSGMMSPGIPI
jgi:hypothetical protein